jgi:phenylacetate-coenzyme A ligase PaaK-like adenylate-forming protein
MQLSHILKRMKIVQVGMDASPDVLREAQNAGLQQMIKRAMRVEFYRQPLTSHGIDSATLTVGDLPRLPCTYKEDLRRCRTERRWLRPLHRRTGLSLWLPGTRRAG